ncbi:MAG: hypothetical protein QM811_28575 [Pirellulales bacterium]
MGYPDGNVPENGVGSYAISTGSGGMPLSVPHQRRQARPDQP